MTIHVATTLSLFVEKFGARRGGFQLTQKSKKTKVGQSEIGKNGHQEGRMMLVVLFEEFDSTNVLVCSLRSRIRHEYTGDEGQA
jgi:hypothetical protein